MQPGVHVPPGPRLPPAAAPKGDPLARHRSPHCRRRRLLSLQPPRLLRGADLAAAPAVQLGQLRCLWPPRVVGCSSQSPALAPAPAPAPAAPSSRCGAPTPAGVVCHPPQPTAGCGESTTLTPASAAVGSDVLRTPLRLRSPGQRRRQRRPPSAVTSPPRTAAASAPPSAPPAAATRPHPPHRRPPHRPRPRRASAAPGRTSGARWPHRRAPSRCRPPAAAA